MPEPTMRELRATLTHTSYCSVLQRGALDTLIEKAEAQS